MSNFGWGALCQGATSIPSLSTPCESGNAIKRQRPGKTVIHVKDHSQSMPWLLLSSRRLQGHSYGIPTTGDPATSEPLPTGSDIALAKLWSRSHSPIGGIDASSPITSRQHEPPDETDPLPKPVDRFHHFFVDSLRTPRRGEKKRKKRKKKRKKRRRKKKNMQNK